MGRVLAVLGTAMQGGLLLAFFGTLSGMLRNFGVLSRGEVLTEQMVSHSVRRALASTVIGYSLALVGLPLLCVAIFAYKYRAPWFYSLLQLVSLLWLFCFPYFTPAGVILLVFLVTHRKGFLRPSTAGPDA